jgi:hypothetical protein
MDTQQPHRTSSREVSAHVRHRDPRNDAEAVLGPGLSARVLEPSPPAVNTGPWFADDPTAVEPTTGGAVVAATGDGDISWEPAACERAAVVRYAQDHWLAYPKRLGPPPSYLAETSHNLRAIAFFVLSRARQEANGKIARRWTKGGFGTPFFGDDQQIRVEGAQLVVQDRNGIRSQPITTLRAAGDFVGVAPEGPTGIDFCDPPPPVDPDMPLLIQPESVRFLDDWFGFSTLVLERLRRIAGMPDDTRVQLWTEHFDPAIELGSAELGQRASYGASPGDSAIPFPYLYVSPWSPHQGDPWTAPFGGAALTLDELLSAEDQVATALEFYEGTFDLLHCEHGDDAA